MLPDWSTLLCCALLTVLLAIHRSPIACFQALEPGREPGRRATAWGALGLAMGAHHPQPLTWVLLSFCACTPRTGGAGAVPSTAAGVVNKEWGAQAVA